MSDSRISEKLIMLHAWICTAIVVLVLSACDPAQQEVEEKDKGAIAPTISSESVVVPRSLSMAILEKEESGEWTSEEAVLTGLRILAGKESTGKSFDPQYIHNGSAGRIISRARIYLDHGADESIKTEVRELLDLVFPQVEKIESFSTPEEEAGLGPSSYRWLDLLVPPAHAILADCVTAWHAAGSTAGTPVRRNVDLGVDCFSRRDRTVNGTNYSYFYPVDWVDVKQKRYVDMAEEALNKSISTYRDLGLPRHTIVLIFIPDALLLTSPDYSAATGSHNGRAIDPKTCVITVQENAWSESDVSFKFTIAHEVFHCEQLWTSERQFNATGGLWWLEGTAEYFANVVYPCSNEEQWAVSIFDEHSNHRGMLNFEYPNVVFFQYLANETGNRGVLNLINRMPATDGLQPQLYALSQYPNISELYHQFGEQYLDRKIADTCEGTVVNVNPDFEYHELTQGNEEIPIPLAPFTLPRHQLIFRAGQYRIDLTGPSSDVIDKSTKLLPPGKSWEDIPEKLDVECGDRIDLQILLTRSNNQSGKTPVKLKLSRRGVMAGERPGGEHGIDSCLVGRWVLEGSSMKSMGNWLASHLDNKFNQSPGVYAKTEFRGLKGSMGGSFTAGGRVYSNAIGFEQKINSDQKHHSAVLKNIDIDMDITININSKSCAEYTADGNELIVWNLISEDEIRSRIVSIINGKRIVSDQPVDFQKGKFPIPMSNNIRFQYRCSDDFLEIDGPLTIEEGAPPLRFHKTASPE